MLKSETSAPASKRKDRVDVMKYFAARSFHVRFFQVICM